MNTLRKLKDDSDTLDDRVIINKSRVNYPNLTLCLEDVFDMTNPIETGALNGILYPISKIQNDGNGKRKTRLS